MLKFASQEKYSIIGCHPHGSKGDMLKYQSSLPRLPVPPLQQSLQKYLKAVRPLINDEEFEKTSKEVEEFGKENGIGEQLQEMLKKRAKLQDNWLTEWWLHVAYLSGRSSLVINSSVCCTFRYPFVNNQTFFHYAMKHIIGVVQFLIACQSEKLITEKSKAGHLCMAQYLNLLSHCRISGKETDSTQTTSIENSHHIIVIHNDHFYSLDILCLLPDGSYTLVPAQHIEEQLHKIVESSPTKAQHPVGVLTTERRDTWYHARERLLTDPQNKSNVDKIESAMFVVCLDSCLPGLNSQSPATANDLCIASARSLHGNGSANGSCNRWFDQTTQVIMSPDGYGGSVLEHSAADGVTAIQTVLYSINNIQSEDLLAYDCPVPIQQLSLAQQLHWNISMKTAEDIEAAKINIDNMVADCDHKVLMFEDFGKEFVKENKLSPDSFIQVAIQLAYYKMYGHLTATYESGSTRLFLNGRTDTIRASSIESLSFCKTMLNPSASTLERAAKLKLAVDAHSKCVVEVISGKGFDRHLLGLNILAKMNGSELPSIFTDDSYAKIFDFGLSTSQVYSDDLMICAFGAVTPGGYGICYNPQKQQIIFTITSFKSSLATDSAKFTTLLCEALQEMKDVIVTAQSITT